MSSLHIPLLGRFAPKQDPSPSRDADSVGAQLPALNGVPSNGTMGEAALPSLDPKASKSEISTSDLSRVPLRKDLFFRFRDERFLPGQGSHRTLCVSGFSSCGYPMMESGHFLNHLYGMPTLVSPLAMHDSYKAFRRTKFEAWVSRIEAQAERLGSSNLLGFFYSASGLAALEVERRNPGTFKAMVLIGLPLELSGRERQALLERVYNLRERCWPLKGVVSKLLEKCTIALPYTYLEASKINRKNPIYDSASIAGLLELREGQLRAYEALQKVRIPIFYEHGKSDSLACPSVFDRLNNLYPRDLLVSERVKGGHGPHLEKDRHKFFRKVAQWLESRVDPSLQKDRELFSRKAA